MKIAWVIHDLDPALGQGRYAAELLPRLAEHHDLHVFANTFRVPPPPGATFHRVPALRTSALTTVLSFPHQANQRLRSGSFDLVHAQGWVCSRADVITAHVLHAARLARDPALGWKYRFFHRCVIPFENAFLRRNPAAHMIAISRKLGEELRLFAGWKGALSIIHHGVDPVPPRDASTQARRRRELGLPERGPLYLFVGEAVKGLAQAINVLPRLPQARLAVVTRSVTGPYQAQAKGLGVSDRVQFLPPRPDLLPVYQAADVFLYPSGYDAFGMVIAEAMAAGLPVIAGSGTGAAEWVKSGHNGFVVDPGEPAAMESILRRLERDPREALRLGAAAREKAGRHTWDECARATLEVYEQALSGRKRKS